MVTLILNLSGSFTIGTAQTRDTSHIVLSTEIARKVVTDLLEGDKAKDQVEQMTRMVEFQKNTILYQDSIVTSIKNEAYILQQRLQDSDNQLQRSLVEQQALRNKASKYKSFAVGFGCGVVISITGIVVILLKN